MNDVKVTKELSDSISTCRISESIACNNGRVTLDNKKKITRTNHIIYVHLNMIYVQWMHIKCTGFID